MKENLASDSVEPGQIEFKEGLTWRSFLGIMYAVIIISPVIIYLNLLSGASLLGPSVYVTIILFSEFARFFMKPLTKQEIYIIFFLIWDIATISSTFFLGFTYRAFFVNTPITMGFNDPYTGIPLPYEIPTWYAPAYGSEAYLYRTLIHSAWFTPLILAVGGTMISLLIDIPLALILTRLYVETERLTFPIAQVNAAVIDSLTERKPDRMRVFTVAAMLSMLYSLFLYGLPIISQGLFGIQLEIIPAPWADFTSLIQIFLPGAILGIGTDPLYLGAGFVVPFPAVLSIFLGSIAVWFIGNTLSLTVFRDFFPLWASEWRAGMGLSLTYQRSYLNVWASPFIGLALAAGILPMLRNIKFYSKALSRLRGISKEAGGGSKYLPLPVMLAMYIAGVAVSITVSHLLVPGFPIWIIALLTAVWPFFFNLVNARALGEAGYPITIPYIWEGAVFASGYRGIDIWFGGGAYMGGASSGWVSYLKVAYLTETKPLSFFKAYLLALPIALVVSFVYTNMVWSMAPIPSSLFPWVNTMWPVMATTSGLWITREISVFRTDLIVGGFVITALLYLGTSLFHIIIPLAALVVGTFTLPPFAITMFVGALLGKFIIPRLVGRDWWENMKATIVAGMGIGQGVMVAVSVTLALIARFKWIEPW